MDRERILGSAYAELRRAQDRVHNVTLDCLPVGCYVSWMVTRGEDHYRQLGMVVRHGYDDTIFVENEATGKLRRLSARHVRFVAPAGGEDAHD